MKKNNLLVAFGLVLCGVLLRLLPHEPNFVPITAIALFSTSLFSKRFAAGIILATMLISDFFIGFHGLILWVYGSYLLIAIMGTYLKNKVTITNTLVTATFSSYVFFIITNFGVWVNSGMYEKTWAGLINCYVMALPFLKNTLSGDLVYVSLFFGSYYILTNQNFKKLVNKNIN